MNQFGTGGGTLRHQHIRDDFAASTALTRSAETTDLYVG